MNVQTWNEFEQALADIKSAPVVAFDTETNGLSVFTNDRMISISVYLPHVDKTYNFPFRHGEGTVKDVYDDFDDYYGSKWAGKAKKATYLAYWFTKIKDNYNYNNLPIDWLEHLRVIWALPSVVYIGHNVKFDLHVLSREGFPTPEIVLDTMIALHTLHEDWGGIQVRAPFKWTKTAANQGLCAKAQVGTWAVEPDGTLSEKLQYGNRQLKWQAARLGLPNATKGEYELSLAARAFEKTIIDYIMANIDDPINEPLIMASFRKNPQRWAESQRKKIEAKIEIDDKAHMWMLPSELVAEYAELDTKLTYQLYEWCMVSLKSWDNEQLFRDMSAIHIVFAYQMERNGFKIDVENAQAELNRLMPRITELDLLISQLTVGICWDKPTTLKFTKDGNTYVDTYTLFDDGGCNLASPTQLKIFLNSGILACEFNPDLWPTWWAQQNRTGTKTYENVNIDATDKEALEPLEDSPVIRIIREHRRMSKSAHTYLGNWLKARDEHDIVRFQMNADGTTTGRFSSSGDAGNGQNIPDRNGYTIKRAIVPYDNNWRLFAIDYSQLELRLAAWIAEGLHGYDPKMTMTNLFISGNDMHSYVRDMINVRHVLFGTMSSEAICVKLGYSQDSEEMENPDKTVAKYCRQAAKTMNFGLLYSGSGRMLSKLLKIERSVADVLVGSWRDLFPAFPKAQAEYTKLALTRRPRPVGELLSMYTTQPLSGRHRRLDMYPTWGSYTDDDGVERQYNPREANAAKTWNSTVQGLGGYICGMSCTRFIQENGNNQVKMFAQIHDAAEGNVRVGQMEEVIKLSQYMTSWPTIVPNLTVDIQGSKDGTWQGMSSVVQLTKWMNTQGKDGYGMKDSLGRQLYKWEVIVTDKDITYTDTAIGVDLSDAMDDLRAQVKAKYPDAKLEVIEPERWEKY